MPHGGELVFKGVLSFGFPLSNPLFSLSPSKGPSWGIEFIREGINPLETTGLDSQQIDELSLHFQAICSGTFIGGVYQVDSFSDRLGFWVHRHS